MNIYLRHIPFYVVDCLVYGNLGRLDAPFKFFQPLDSVRQFFGAPGTNPMGTAPTTGDTLVELDPCHPELSVRLSPSVLTRNYVLAALAGVIWYFQFFFYSMGQTKMGKYDFSSWTLHMASIIIFATLWGIAEMKV